MQPLLEDARLQSVAIELGIISYFASDLHIPQTAFYGVVPPWNSQFAFTASFICKDNHGWMRSCDGLH